MVWPYARNMWDTSCHFLARLELLFLRASGFNSVGSVCVCMRFRVVDDVVVDAAADAICLFTLCVCLFTCFLFVFIKHMHFYYAFTWRKKMNTCHHPFHLGFFHDPSKPPTFLFFCFLLIHTSHTKTGVHKTNEKNIKEKHEKKTQNTWSD